MADLNEAVLAKQNTRTHVLRKALAACRMRSIACGLPPAKPLPEPEIRGVFHEMMSAWEKEARRCEGQDLREEAGLVRQEIAVLSPYLEAPDPETSVLHLRRHTHRVNLGPGFTVRFFLMGEAIEGVRVVNLGGGGCRLELDPELAELLLKGTHLHNLSFCHPDLPAMPTLAEVAYLLGKRAGGRGTQPGPAKVIAGVKFLNPPAEFEAALAAYVEARCVAEEDSFSQEWQERIPRLDTEAFEPRGLGPGFKARFFLLDEPFQGVTLHNLGAGGCCLVLHPDLAEIMKIGTRLHNFSLCHPALPPAPQLAEVLYVREEELESGVRRVFAGVRFLHPKLEFQTEISTFVRRELGKAV